MKPTEQEQRCEGLLEAMQKRLVLWSHSPGLTGAITTILSPRLMLMNDASVASAMTGPEQIRPGGWHVTGRELAVFVNAVTTVPSGWRGIRSQEP